jgi:uncharacterized membrane protein YbjE (DUF340 family)
MWMIIIPLVGGYIFAAKKPDWVARLPVAAISNASLILLLLVMGARLGANPQVVSKLGRIGGQALLMAVSAVIGSTFFLYLLGLLLPKAKAQGDGGDAQQAQGPAGFKLTFLLLGSVVVGFFLGLTIAKGMAPLLTEAATWVLGLLLLGVGLDLGGASQAFAGLKQLGLTVILIPAGIMAGSILGGVLTALISGLSWQEGAAVASGFGWYSLSSVLISEIHSPLLGALAFLANVLRELIAIIITPLIARLLGPVAAIGPAGATAMDVMLPVIARSTGKEYVPLAFFAGAVLSLAVPVCVNFFLSIMH